MKVSQFKSQNFPRFALLPIPKSLDENLDSELRKIVKSFQLTVAAMPTDLLGAQKNPVRDKFVARQVERWVVRGPRCLSLESVQTLLDIGFGNLGISIAPGQTFVKVLFKIVADGLTMGLDALLRSVEISATLVSDEFLKEMNLNDDQIEIFRRLLPAYSGTLDELVETAKSV